MGIGAAAPIKQLVKLSVFPREGIPHNHKQSSLALVMLILVIDDMIREKVLGMGDFT